MSPSIVTALNVSSTPSRNSLRDRRRDRCVGENERQHGAHIGRDHAGALGDAADGHRGAAEPDHRGRAFGERVGGHDRLGGVLPATRRGIGDKSRHDALEFRGVERLTNHAGGGEKHLVGLAAGRLGGDGGGEFGRGRPVLPVNALALPELTTTALAVPPLMRARHQSTGADGHFDWVKTPATTVPGRARRAARRCVPHSGYRQPPSQTARRRPAAFRETMQARGGRWRSCLLFDTGRRGPVRSRSGILGYFGRCQTQIAPSPGPSAPVLAVRFLFAPEA